MKVTTLTLCELAEHSENKVIVRKPISKIIAKEVPFLLKCYVASSIEFDESESTKPFSLIYGFTDPSGSPIGKAVVGDKIYPHRPSNTYNYSYQTIVELSSFGVYHLHLAVSGSQHKFKFSVLQAPDATYFKSGEEWIG